MSPGFFYWPSHPIVRNVITYSILYRHKMRASGLSFPSTINGGRAFIPPWRGTEHQKTFSGPSLSARLKSSCRGMYSYSGRETSPEKQTPGGQMKLSLALGSVLLIASPALAQQTTNVTQSGPSNEAVVAQENNPSSGALIRQEGDSDVAQILQVGNDGETRGIISQSGSDGASAFADIDTFVSTDTRARIEQQNGGVATIDQLNQLGSVSTASQSGNTNQLELDQMGQGGGLGVGNRQNFNQSGQNNIVRQTQIGSGNVFAGQQSGLNNVIENASPVGPTNDATFPQFSTGADTFQQIGVDNRAIITQGGANNVASLSQNGVNNQMIVNQTGTGGRVTIIQNN